MKYAIVYGSKTGNTAMLAEQIPNCLPTEDCIYRGGPAPGAGEGADIIFAGFWTDKGGCCEEMAVFLRSLRNTRLFLFGTAGFGGAAEYFEQILARVERNADSSNQIVGTYMCQGKMPFAVRLRYEAMPQADADKASALLENFQKALSHPDANDLNQFQRAIETVLL